MSNTLFKQSRQLIVVPPAPPPPPAAKRKLVKRTGYRPRYTYVTVITGTVLGGIFVVSSLSEERTQTGQEVYEYYEWVIEGSPIPAPPAPVVTPIPPAWDASARSGITLTEAVAVEWNVGVTSVDVICGLSTLPESPPLPRGVDAAEDARRAALMRDSVLHGFRVSGGVAYVHHAPPAAFGSVALEYRHPAWPVTADSVCRVEMTKGIVRYLIDDELIATGPAYVYRGEGVYLRAALYAPGDVVDNPLIESVTLGGEADITLAPLMASGGRRAEGRAMFGIWANGPRRLGILGTLGPLWAKGGRLGGGANMQLAPLSVWGWGLQANGANGAATVGPIMLKGGGDAGYADGDAMLGLWAFGRGQEAPPQNNAVTAFGSLVDASIDPRPHRGAYATASLGCTFDAEHVSNRQLRTRVGMLTTARAARVYPGRFETILGVRGITRGERVLNVSLVTGLGVALPTIGLLIVTAEFDTALGVSANLLNQRALDAALRTALGVTADLDPQATYQALLRTVLGVGTPGTRDANDYLVWSVERGGASAAYSGWAFNSFAKIGGRIFAAADTGLYELGGADDDGEPIAAWVNLGQRNFGSTMLKGITNAYLTASSDAKLVVRVTTPDGKSYTYRARRADAAMMAQRVDFGKGLRATYLNLEITNDGDGDFDLERAEFIVTESTRRI